MIGLLSVLPYTSLLDEYGYWINDQSRVEQEYLRL